LEPAGDLAGKRVLDVGCGLGGKTMAYGEAGAKEVYGTDLSVENAGASARFAGKGDRRFRWGFFVADAARLPLEPQAFESVVANDAMEHFAQPENALVEMARVTRRGGAIWIFFTPHFSPLGSHLYDYVYTPWCHLIFRRKDLERAVTRILRDRHPEWAATELDLRSRQIMKSYDTDLNHMSIRRFDRMLARLPGFAVSLREHKPAKYAFLAPLTRIPLVRELFTGTVVCRLERTR